MVAAVADTHVVLWYLFSDTRLSSVARASILDAAYEGLTIAVSSISVAEIVYLVEKRRVPPQAYDKVVGALTDPEDVFVEAVFTLDVAEAMRSVSREEVPDMPDRIVAATAVHLGVPVISRDRRIRAANLRSVW